MNKATQASIPWPTPVHAPGVVFYVRHGQCRSNTIWPIEGYHDGLDPLTELGRHQSRQLGRLLAELVPDVRWRLYSSGLRRAVETVAIVEEHVPCLSTASDERLNEWADKREPERDLFQRIDSFLEDVALHTCRVDERVLVVTHAHVLSALACRALGASIRLVDKGDYGGQAGLTTHANCGLSAFYRGDMLLWNSQAHLPVQALPPDGRGHSI